MRRAPVRLGFVLMLLSLLYVRDAERAVFAAAQPPARACEPLSAAPLSAHATWGSTYGGEKNDYANAIVPTSDGGYIVAGDTYSFGAGYADAWVLKLDARGEVVWQHVYGGSEHESVSAIVTTNDGGYLMVGRISSGTVEDDVWVVKLDGDGSVQWQKTYGGSEFEGANDVVSTNGGYLVIGYTYSFGAGVIDAWVLRLNPSGAVMWQKTIAHGSDDYGRAVVATEDGGFVIAGTTLNLGSGLADGWVIKLSSGGDIVWQKMYGGSRDDRIAGLARSSDGGIMLIGSTTSVGSGNFDMWLAKLNDDGLVIWQKTYGGALYDGTASIIPQRDGSSILAGTTRSFGTGAFDVWMLKLDVVGGVIWQKTYGGNRNEELLALTQAADGGLVFAGYSESFGMGGRDMLVVKLDANGNIRINCEFVNPSFVVGVPAILPSLDTLVQQRSTAAPAAPGLAAVSNTAVDREWLCLFKNYLAFARVG